jgi:hypothetical protein
MELITHIADDVITNGIVIYFLFSYWGKGIGGYRGVEYTSLVQSVF